MSDRSGWDKFYAGDPNDSELGRFPARRLVVTDEGVEFEPSALVFNEEETAIDEHIVAALHGIHDLGLKVNHQELAHAVHTMQLFVIKHMLQRLGSPEFSEWYHTPEPPTFGAYGRLLQETADLAKRNAERAEPQVYGYTACLAPECRRKAVVDGLCSKHSAPSCSMDVPCPCDCGGTEDDCWEDK